jgi:hypothetical protein
MKKQNLALVLVGMSLLSGVASASDATDAIATIGTEAAALATAAWPIVTAIVIATIGMKLFKKFSNKAT